MKEIKRYDIECDINRYDIECKMEEWETGDYVKYEDVEPAIKLFEIMKEKIGYIGKNCRCQYIGQFSCDVFKKGLKIDDTGIIRCQQCIDIFGGME